MKRLNLQNALDVQSGEIIAFVGAGGKSSAIVALSEELVKSGRSVLVAPTTKMFLVEAGRIGPSVTSEDFEELSAMVAEALIRPGAVVAGSGFLTKERIGGLDPAWIPGLSHLADVTLVEADGSRRRPIKGTAPHEPVLPEAATLVVAVGNVEALGKPVDKEFVHRPEVFSTLTGAEPGQSITPGSFARALVHGSLGKLSPDKRRAVLLTGVEEGRSMADATAIAREVRHLGDKKVLLSLLTKEHPPRVWLLQT